MSKEFNGMEDVSLPMRNRAEGFRFSDLHASRTTQSNGARYRLFMILKKAGENLEAELCPNESRSIYTKACDVVRNLPHWQRYVGKFYMTSEGADLSEEAEVCSDVLEHAERIANELRPYSNKGLKHHPLTGEKLSNLINTVRSALETLNGGFNSSESRPADTNLGESNSQNTMQAPTPDVQ